MAELRLFEEVELPILQKSVNGIAFPSVLFPNPKFKNTDQLSALTDAIQAHKPWLESLLRKSGALLFRGFPVTSPSDFNDVIEAFGYPDMPYTGGSVVRDKVVSRVLTANESPPEERIHFHNEMAYAASFPAKLFFFCEVEPGKGGETGIVPSHVVCERMKEKYPEFVQQLEEHGVMYTKRMAEEDSPIVGTGWKTTFSTDDKSIAEQRAMKFGLKMEWQDNTALVTTSPLPAVKFDKEMQRKTWFNSIAVANGTPEGRLEKRGPDLLAILGNGEPLPAHIVQDCIKVMDEESVAIPWQKGDVLLIDNILVLHSRLPLIRPPRRILASLCK